MESFLPKKNPATLTQSHVVYVAKVPEHMQMPPGHSVQCARLISVAAANDLAWPYLRTG